jgi:hypothetical protein
MDATAIFKVDEINNLKNKFINEENLEKIWYFLETYGIQIHEIIPNKSSDIWKKLHDVMDMLKSTKSYEMYY